jgi:hypothetical protein
MKALVLDGSREGDTLTPIAVLGMASALDLAATSLAAGGDIPVEAATRFAKPLMTRWMYTIVGNLQWRMQLRKNKARRPLTYRPYSQG